MKNLHDMLRDSWWTQHPLVRVVLFVLGLVLILLGAILGFVPLLPGFPLGILGVILLSISSARVRHVLIRGIEKLPAKWQRHLQFISGSDPGPGANASTEPAPANDDAVVHHENAAINHEDTKTRG